MANKFCSNMRVLFIQVVKDGSGMILPSLTDPESGFTLKAQCC